LYDLFFHYREFPELNAMKSKICKIHSKLGYSRMQLLVITNDSLKAELCSTGEPDQCCFSNELNENSATADVVIDLLFRNEPGRIAALKKAGRLVVVNSVLNTLAQTDPSFIRINGWSTLLKGSLVEAASLDEMLKPQAEAVFALFGKAVRWTPDLPGFITPRVISAIINEAYLALSEGVSSKEEIDTAMKLGTNYPYGPFEWCAQIGRHNVSALLHLLSKKQARYRSYVPE
jgi:3-hydroxybutyryl-CoA dehydrogenase